MFSQIFSELSLQFSSQIDGAEMEHNLKILQGLLTQIIEIFVHEDINHLVSSY